MENRRRDNRCLSKIDSHWEDYQLCPNAHGWVKQDTRQYAKRRDQTWKESYLPRRTAALSRCMVITLISKAVPTQMGAL